MAMYKKFDVVKNTKDGCWYIKIKENDGIFENYKDKSISGNLLISLKGYQEPVKIKCNLSTKAEICSGCAIVKRLGGIYYFNR